MPLPSKTSAMMAALHMLRTLSRRRSTWVLSEFWMVLPRSVRTVAM